MIDWKERGHSQKHGYYVCQMAELNLCVLFIPISFAKQQSWVFLFPLLILLWKDLELNPLKFTASRHFTKFPETKHITFEAKYVNLFL